MKTPEQIAKAIGRKAVSDDYVEDGGYIRDWLVNDIAQAIRAYGQECYEDAAKIAKKWGDSAKGNMLNTGYAIADGTR